MARARNIKPGFFESEDPAKVGYPQRLLWIALWTLADREGRLEYRPARIKKYAFGFDSATVDQIGVWVQDLHAAGLIVLYPVGSVEVIQCVNFDKHQKPHRNDPPSEFPPPKNYRGIPGETSHNGGNSPGNFRALGEIPGSTTLPTPTSPGIPGALGEISVKHRSTEATPREFPDVERLQRASPGMNVECGMLNVEGGRGKGALALPAPRPQQLAIDASGPDPDELFQAAARFACETLPAGGDVGLTAAAMRSEFQKSASFEGNPAGFCLSYTAAARKWRAAYDANPDLRTKAAQWWTRDGTYAQSPPAPRAPRRFGPVDLKAGLEVEDAL